MLQELLFDGREQGFRTGGADQASVLHLLIGQVVRALEHQDPHHGFRRVGRTATLQTDRTRRDPIHLGRQRGKVDMVTDPYQGIPQLIELLLVHLRRKQVGLDRALP